MKFSPKNLLLVLGVISIVIFGCTRSSDSQNSRPSKSPKCVVGGCSGQLCVDINESGGMMSTCEWQEGYNCYKKAKCEMQKDGQCGWTETPEYKSCVRDLQNKQSR